MNDAEKRNPKEGEGPGEEFGWEFHKVPLLIALVLTAILYVIIFWLAAAAGH